MSESYVVRNMRVEPATESRSACVWVPFGAGLFIVALIISAAVVPQLRLLHLFQALIYVAVVRLARRNSAWGFGAGVAIAVAWNSLNLFVTHLMWAGAVAFWHFLRTGHVHRLDTMMVLLGGIAHFVLIIACLTVFFHSSGTNRQWWKFAGGGVLVLAYFGLIVATMAPH
ncbi:MAG TPA: hypothetical protein VM912_00610 [Terriglobales bacterium]|nr:hypothetical protein [Terriglobales bacterium]